jgi:hypothetical protein
LSRVSFGQVEEHFPGSSDLSVGDGWAASGVLITD